MMNFVIGIMILSDEKRWKDVPEEGHNRTAPNGTSML
jgi:hypothetical protein